MRGFTFQTVHVLTLIDRYLTLLYDIIICSLKLVARMKEEMS